MLLFVCAVCWAQKPELIVQTGHSDTTLNALAFSADGKLLASGGNDSAIKLWEAADGRQLRTLNGHSDDILSLAFSRDGKMLASGSADDTIKLWELATGRESRTITGHTDSVFFVAFSADSRTLFSFSGDTTIRQWDVATGRELRTITKLPYVGKVALSANAQVLASHSNREPMIKLWNVATGQELRTLTVIPNSITALEFSPDGKILASSSHNTIKLWDVNTGKELSSVRGQSQYLTSIAFDREGKVLAGGGSDGTTKLWDVASGKELRTLVGHWRNVNSIQFNVNEQTLATCGRDGKIKLWEIATGREVRALDPRALPIRSMAISPDGKTIVSGNNGGTLKVWDLTMGRELRTLTGHMGSIRSVALTADGKTLASGDIGKTIKLWDVASGDERHTITAHSNWIRVVTFSGDGRTLASTGDGAEIKLWDVNTGREVRTITGQGLLIEAMALTSDGKMLASKNPDNTIQLYDVTTGRELRTLRGHDHSIFTLAFSRDARILASGSTTIKLWDSATGRELRTLEGPSAFVNSVAFSPDGKTLAGGSFNHTITLWDVDTGRELRTLTGHSHYVSSVMFSGDGKFLVSGGYDATTKLWRVATGELLATLIALDDRDWAVVTPDGRFDASPNAQKLMHWMVGNEPIELEQLKERYYEPGLLAKIVGFNKEPLRDVSAFRDVKLFPTAQWKTFATDPTKAELTLTNRGGGIGKVQIFVNGREVIADARGQDSNPNQKEQRRQIDLQQFDRFMVPGEENRIEVITHNAEGYLASRGTVLVYTPSKEKKIESPSLLALVVGVSNYREGGNLSDLNFAAKDAEAMFTTFKAAGERLFPGKTSIQLLSTSSDKPELRPTKTNIINELKELSNKAKSTDILLLYFAGHGVSYGGQDGDFYFLTADASTADLKDIELRDTTALSSEELARLILNIPANKQVMILDTCASGRLIEQLTKSRNVDSSTIRAWERMKDRTGLWILAGSAADAVSYESSRYGQGVLTYSLLRGMKVDFEKALRKGEGESAPELVDVSTLFNYSADAVPSLAKGIGGIQKPLIASKHDARSFDIGRVNAANREIIPYTLEKPVYLRSNFQLAGRPRDTLNLSNKIDMRLREVSARGLNAPLVFWDLPEHPGAYRIAGRYEMNGTLVSVQVFVSTFVLAGERIEEKDVGQPFTVEGDAGDADAVVARILEKADMLIASSRRT